MRSTVNHRQYQFGGLFCFCWKFSCQLSMNASDPEWLLIEFWAALSNLGRFVWRWWDHLCQLMGTSVWNEFPCHLLIHYRNPCCASCHLSFATHLTRRGHLSERSQLFSWHIFANLNAHRRPICSSCSQGNAIQSLRRPMRSARGCFAASRFQWNLSSGYPISVRTSHSAGIPWLQCTESR